MAGFVKTNMLWGLLALPLGLVSLYYYLFKRKPRLDLEGKVVFITGASSGLGKACAKAFFHAQCKVILSGRSKDRLLEVKNELFPNQDCNTGCEPDIFVMDLEDLASIPDKMKEVLSIFGQVDIVVNNAGLSSRGLAIDTDLEVYQRLMNVNFYAQCLVTKDAASKHALEGYFNSLRAELCSFNIDVCIVNPGYIKTNLSMNAVCGDGSQSGELDNTTAKGYDPSYVAAEIVDCVINRSENRLICPTYMHLAICLRIMMPSLFFKLMERRHKKEQQEIKKKT